MGASVDYLDVLNEYGPEHVRRYVLELGELAVFPLPATPGPRSKTRAKGNAAPPQDQPSEPSSAAVISAAFGGDAVREMIGYPAPPIDINDARRQRRLILTSEDHPDFLARWVLANKFLPPRPSPDSPTPVEDGENVPGVWMVRRHGDWIWRRNRNRDSIQAWGRWEPKAFRSAIGRYLCYLWKHAPTEDEPLRIKALCPSSKKMEDVMGGMIEYIDTPDPSMPCWLPPSFDEDGWPTWESMTELEQPAVMADEISVGWGTDRPSDRFRPEGAPPVRFCVAAQNGIFDVQAYCRDQEIRLLPPTPRFFNSACLPFKIPVNEWRQAIDDGEDEAFHKRNCPESMKYLWDSAMRANPSDPQAWMDRVQEVVGYMPSWYRAMHAVFLLYGGSGSGKDVMLSLLESVVGEHNVSTHRPSRLTSPFETFKMMGKHMMRMSEMRIDPKKTDTADLLNVVWGISGQVKQSVEDKHKSGVQTANVEISGAFVLATDQMLNLRDQADAGLRRLVIIPFEPFDGKEDRDLKERIRREAAGLFMWGMDGLRRLIQNRRFTPVEAADDILTEISHNMAPVKKFRDEMCVCGPGQGVRADILRELFKAWTEQSGESWLEEVSEEKFGHMLKAIKGVKREKAARYEPGGKPFRCYLGIRPKYIGEDKEREDAIARGETWTPKVFDVERYGPWIDQKTRVADRAIVFARPSGEPPDDSLGPS